MLQAQSKGQGGGAFCRRAENGGSKDGNMPPHLHFLTTDRPRASAPHQLEPGLRPIGPDRQAKREPNMGLCLVKMAAPISRCHYDVLELPRTATVDDVKAAYRRLALIHHPDKNGGTQESTDRFRTIQTAYSILTDENERAWYDAHREDIVGGGVDKSERLVNVYAYFSGDCFDGMDDAPRGFYTVFADVFRRVAAEEGRYAEPDAPPSPPLAVFGDAATPGDAVAAFYASWGAFASRTTFSWADEHNPLEAANRYERRAMEKENKKLRDTARRERSESVRALVSYCQRRDKRYLLHVVEARRRADEDEARRRAVQQERARAAAEERAACAAEHAREAAAREEEIRASGSYRLADDDASAQRGGGSRKRAALEAARAAPGLVVRAEIATDAAGPDDFEDDEGAVTVFVCEVCDKSFRSAAAMANHESSKKHVQNLRALGIPARPAGASSTVDAALMVPEPLPPAAVPSFASFAGDASPGVSTTVACAHSAEGDRPAQADGDAHARDDDDGDAAAHESSDSDSGLAGGGLGGSKKARKKLARAATRKAQLLASLVSPETDDEGGDAAAEAAEGGAAEPEAAVVAALAKPPRKARRAAKADRPPPPPAEGSVASLLAAAAAVSISGAGRGGGGGRGEKQPRKALHIAGAGFAADAALCEVCAERFETRNALFAHIRATGHAALHEERGGGGSRAARKAAR